MIKLFERMINVMKLRYLHLHDCVHIRCLYCLQLFLSVPGIMQLNVRIVFDCTETYRRVSQFIYMRHHQLGFILILK